MEAKHVTVDGGLSSQFQWDTKRGRDFQNLAHFVYCCDGLPNENLPTAQKLEVWLSRVDPPGDQLKKEIDETLREMWMIAKERSLNKGFTAIGKRLAPVEFVFVGKYDSYCCSILSLTKGNRSLAIQTSQPVPGRARGGHSSSSNDSKRGISRHSQ